MPRSIYLSVRSRGNIYMYKYEVYMLHIYGDKDIYIYIYIEREREIKRGHKYLRYND